MNQKIIKLSNLKLLESFVQINFVKGFKYIDKAGEIINRYQNKEGEIAYNMSPNRLVIPNPIKGLDELKISNIDFWCHFIEPANLGEVIRISDKEASEVLGITNPGDIKRIGFRNYFAVELKEAKTNLNSLVKFTVDDVSQVAMNLSLEKAETNVIISLLKKKDSHDYALLFDIDAFVTGTFGINEIGGKLKLIKTELESEKNKKFLNETLKLL